METALDLVTLAGGFGTAWLANRSLDPWRKAAGKDGGTPYRRAERLYVAGLVVSFFAGGIATQFILLWLG